MLFLTKEAVALSSSLRRHHLFGKDQQVLIWWAQVAALLFLISPSYAPFPKIDFEAGLRSTIDWYQTYGSEATEVHE